MRKTEHICDGCGQTVERPKDLRRFELSRRGRPSMSITFDACDDCEGRMLGELSTFVAEDFKHKLLDMRRQDG